MCIYMFTCSRSIKRSIKFRIHLWGHRFSQNSNQKFYRFLPYQTTRIIAKKLHTHQTITKKSARILVCLVGQKSGKILFGILGEPMTSLIHSEFNWPLVLNFQRTWFCSNFLFQKCHFRFCGTKDSYKISKGHAFRLEWNGSRNSKQMSDTCILRFLW